MSVVVAAFDAGPYIERCLASLFAQTTPLEVIVVDDGSTDDTADRVGATDLTAPHSLSLLRQENRGLSAARNAGLACASGRWVSFVDADDWVDSGSYHRLVAEAERYGAELVVAGGTMVDHLTGERQPFHDEARFRDLAARRTAAFDPRNEPEVFRLDTSACRRLYSREFLDRCNFRFAPGLLFEDVPAHFELLLRTESLLLVDLDFYRYRIRHPGRITDRRDRQILTIFDGLAISAAALRRHRAEDPIWASFLWFQSWVVRWLATRIEPTRRRAYAHRAVRFARSLPRGAHAAFRRRFADDAEARRVVRLQVAGFGRTLVAYANGELGRVDRCLLALADRIEAILAHCGASE